MVRGYFRNFVDDIRIEYLVAYLITSVTPSSAVSIGT
ncbi:hypothetical protein X975_12364, partial [Stegodyphus mimosarum]